jgi:hypothetical protein
MNPPENDPISKLIALKRYERMPDGFEDELIHRLHLKQRQDLMTQSLGSMLKERVLEFWEMLGGPRLALAGAAVLVLLAGVIRFLPERSDAQRDVANNIRLSDLPLPPGFEVLPPEMTNTLANFGTKLPPDEAARLSPVLLSNHFVGGYSDEIREAVTPEFVKPLMSLKFEVMPMIQFAPDENDEPERK